jgi:predicted DCC family thiol-disulfide oxidoreductase YuxK
LTFYYDADCDMCSALARWAMRNTRATMRTIQQSQAELLRLGVPAEGLFLTAHADSGGALLSGSQAIAALLADSDRAWVRAVGCAAQLPLARNVAALGYRAVANNRGRLSRLFKL